MTDPAHDHSHSTIDPSSAAAELEAVLSASNDAIFTKNLDNIITSWSACATSMFGYTADEAIGRLVAILVPPDRIAEVDTINERIREGRIFEGETERLTKSGEVLRVALRIVPVKDVDGRTLKAVVVARDVTPLREAERQVAELRSTAVERALVLETANRVALDILSSRAGVEALSHIADGARTLARARYAALGVARPDGQGLQEFVTVGLTPEQERAIGPRPGGEGVLGLLLRRTDPLRVDALSSLPESVGFPPNHPVMDSFLGVPIRRGDTALGSLYLTEKEGGGGFTEADELAVQALGAHAAVAIHNLFTMARQRALVSGLINAQEEERRAVAYDLHDGLTQYVMASHMHLEASRMARERGNSEKADRELERGVAYLKESVMESRRLVNGLRSLALEDLGLAGALEQLVSEEKERSGWSDVEVAHNIASKRFHKTLETAAYRVVQEALTNSRKHAETDRVRVIVLLEPRGEADGSTLTVEVRDWGQGFTPEEKAGDYGHLGLHGIFERIQLLGGTYELRTAPGEGTLIRARFPVRDDENELMEG